MEENEEKKNENTTKSVNENNWSKKYSCDNIIIIFCCGIIAITAIFLCYMNKFTSTEDYQVIESTLILISGNSSTYEIISNYDQYIYYINEIRKSQQSDVEIKYDEDFFTNNSLIIISKAGWNFELFKVKEKGSEVKIQIYCDVYGYVPNNIVMFIPVSNDVTTANIKFVNKNEYSKTNKACIAIFVTALSIIICTVLRKKYMKKISENSQIFIRIFEILFTICLGGIGCVILIMLWDCCESSLIASIMLLLAFFCIAMPIRLILELKKEKKVVKTIGIILGIIIVLACTLLLLINEAKVTISDKPIIYLYPEEETEVSVELGYPDNITVSYPKYETGWNVLAKTDGNLTDLTTGRNLYSLYIIL